MDDTLNKGELAAAVKRVRKFAEGDTINGTYRMMPIASVVAFRNDLLLILDALRAQAGEKS